MLTAAGTVACVATLFGFLGRLWWFFDLFSHFRVQYAVGLSICGVLLLLGRRWKTALALLAFACANLALVLPLYLGGSEAPPVGTPTVRAMLVNVNQRLGSAERVRDVVSARDPDILVLEEISSRLMSDLAWLGDSHPHSPARPREDNFGIGIFSKWPLVDAEVIFIGSAEIPSIVATIVMQETKVRVVATHPAPPAGGQYSQWRNEQLDELADYLRSPLPVLLIGDLNATPWS